ncbi:MAG: bestrophin family protein [Bacteroidia bacterium]
MITYNPKSWIQLIFAFHRSDTFRILIPAMLAIALYTAIVAYVEIEILDLRFKSSVTMHSLMGFVLSLLLVFRTNTAYDRWWEGRRLWGAFVNHSRSLTMKVHSFLPADAKDERERYRVLLSNYFFACRDHLRQLKTTDDWISHPDIDNAAFLNKQHVPNALLLELTRLINSFETRGLTDKTRLLMCNEELRSLAESLGACERIRNTPIPYSYSMFLKKIIFFYTLTMPFGFVTDFKYVMIPIIIFIFYVFTSIELLAEEIEDPFGTDVNDLPTDELAGKIGSAVKEILES